MGGHRPHLNPRGILKGGFDKYVESKKVKRGTAEVDAAFLAEIARWQELLARNIALRNPGLSQREINFSVQIWLEHKGDFLSFCVWNELNASGPPPRCKSSKTMNRIDIPKGPEQK